MTGRGACKSLAVWTALHTPSVAVLQIAEAAPFAIIFCFFFCCSIVDLSLPVFDPHEGLAPSYLGSDGNFATIPIWEYLE